MKKCYNCGLIKDFTFFSKNKASKDGLSALCKNCDNERRQIKNMTPDQIEAKRSNQRVESLSVERLEKKRIRQKLDKRKETAGLSLEEKEERKNKNRTINLTVEQLEKRRARNRVSNFSSKRLEKLNIRKNSPNFRIRASITAMIGSYLRKNYSSKNGLSCLTFLDYTIEELKNYLESLFEPWMNWNNRGKYNSILWNDNEPSTWTWQLDHIIPQSDLPYTSMEDENFKKVWALSNLRPLSAKQNILDGTSRSRHKK